MTTTTKTTVPPSGGSTGRLETISPRGSAPTTLRLGLIGFGQIGRAFRDLIARRREILRRDRGVDLVIERVLVRDPSRDRGDAGALVTTAAADFLAGAYDVVVEAASGPHGVEPVVRALLERGTAVVTANKALVAEHGAALAGIAARTGAAFRFEASVAPGIPLFQLLERSLQSTRFRRIEAILNGTTNFVLSRLAEGCASIEAALDEARALGFAEPDPFDDLSGLDAARKLAILATALGSEPVPVSAIATRGIAGIRAEDCARAVKSGHRLKLVAFADLETKPVVAWVAPTLVPEAGPLATVDRERNGIQLFGDGIGDLFLSGAGAGPGPTSVALLDDVLCAIDAPAPRSIRRAS